MVEIISGDTVVSYGVLQLPKVVKCLDLFESELDSKEEGQKAERRLLDLSSTYTVGVLQVLKVLEFILAKGLRNFGILDDAGYGLRLLLELLNILQSFCSLYGELWIAGKPLLTQVKLGYRGPCVPEGAGSSGCSCSYKLRAKSTRSVAFASS